MSVFSKIKGFFSRHRNKFIVGGIIITGSIFLSNYAQQKLKEWQEKQLAEFLETNRKQKLFQTITGTCNQTIANLSVALNETVARAADTDEIIKSLKDHPERKTELWNKLKVEIFVKAGCSIYATVILVITLKMQLSVIGGYLYRDSNAISSETQEKYLSICQNLLNSGVQQLAQLLEEKCTTVLESVELNKNLRLSDIEAIFWSIQLAVEKDELSPITNFRQYIFPDVLNENLDHTYNKILQETVDLLDSTEIQALMSHCITQNFTLLCDQISNFCNQPSSSEDKFMNPFQAKHPFTKFLLIINKIFMRKPTPDPFLQLLISNKKVMALAANVYESFL